MDSQTTAPQSPAQRVGTVGQETADATKGVAATAGHEAERVTREAKDQVRQLWGQTRTELTDQASVQQGRAAAGLRELGDQLGSMASAGDQDGIARGLVEDVARRAGDAAAWLEQREPGTLLEEARGFARRRPGTFLALAAGVGLVAGRLSRSLADEARDSDAPPTTRPTGTGAGTGTGTGTASRRPPRARRARPRRPRRRPAPRPRSPRPARRPFRRRTCPAARTGRRSRSAPTGPPPRSPPRATSGPRRRTTTPSSGATDDRPAHPARPAGPVAAVGR